MDSVSDVAAANTADDAHSDSGVGSVSAAPTAVDAPYAISFQSHS